MRSSTRVRIALRGLIALLVIALIAGTVLTIRSRTKPALVAAPSPDSFFQTEKIRSGDLTTTERLDGTVALASTFNVIHRIDTPAQTAPTVVTKSAPTPTLAQVRPTTPAPTPVTVPTTRVVPGRQPSRTASNLPADSADSQPPATDAPAPKRTVLTPIPTTSPAPQQPVQGSGRSNRPTERVTQTVTSIISANTILQSGDVLYTVDGKPVVSLDGALPVWRSLSIASPDGADIQQLETSLVALGFDPTHRVTVNQHFDAATQTMVKAWQRSLGATATGALPIGTIVFVPAASTVTAVSQTVGAKIGDGDNILTLAATTQNVVINVPVGDQAQVVPGLRVQVSQSNTQINGTVTQIRSAIQNNSAVVQAVIRPEKLPAQVSAGATVKVTVTLIKATGALLVPAAALVSKLDGSYAIQVGDKLANARWMTVELVDVSGTTAAIRGDALATNTNVLVPV